MAARRLATGSTRATARRGVGQVLPTLEHHGARNEHEVSFCTDGVEKNTVPMVLKILRFNIVSGISILILS